MKSCNEIILFPLSYFDLRWGPKNGLNARSPFNTKLAAYLHTYFLGNVLFMFKNEYIMDYFPVKQLCCSEKKNIHCEIDECKCFSSQTLFSIERSFFHVLTA